MVARITIPVVILLLLAAVPAAGADGPMRNLTIQPGDQITVKVVGYKDLEETYSVDSDGTIEMVLVGRLSVIGLDPESVRETVTQAYWKHLVSRPQIIVQPRYRVGVVGQVQKPGLFHIEGTETVTQLLALAGGPSREARLSKVTLSHNGESETRNLERALQTGETVYQMGIQSGDILYIPQTPWYKDWRNWSTLVSSALLVVNVVDRVNR